MIKTNIELGFRANCDYEAIEVEEGQQLTRAPVIVAYFNLAFKEWAEEELGLSSDEVVATINGVEFTDGMDDEAREIAVLDALNARKRGETGADVSPIMDVISAQKVRADASNYGAKLPKTFTDHVNVYLDAIDDVKLACLVCLDDVAGRVWTNTDPGRNWKGGAWSKEDIMRLPVPGTKAPKGTEITESNRHQWDSYRYKTSTKEVINSSFYLDAAIATEPGSTIWDRLQELTGSTDALKSDADKKEKETLRKRLNNCAKFLRDGVTVAKALIEFERLGGKLVYEVQRDEDGSPEKGTPYPVRIWPQGASGKAESCTLSNMKTMLKLDAKGLNVVDVAISKGGKFADFKAAMPQKERGKDKTTKVNNGKQFFFGLDAFTAFLNSGGDIQANKRLQDKETGLGDIESLGNFMALIGPIWESYKADYAELKARERTATARKIADKHNKAA
jgi:hypothetical protein